MALVACTGIATLDLILTVDELPTGDGKYLAHTLDDSGGGVAANAAVAVARLGGRSTLASAVGDDDTGRRIVADLDRSGVGTDRVARIPGTRSSVSVVLVDRAGARIVVNHTDADLFDRTEPGPAAEIDGADAVLVDCRWPAGALASLDAARRVGVPGVVDLDRPMTEGVAPLLAAASHVVCSRDALLASTGTTDPVAALGELARHTDAWLAVTEGAEGTRWLDGGRPRHHPAPTIVAVDTTGAGDVYHGAFALALAEGSSEIEAVRFATAAAAAKCLAPGGRSAIPDRRAVEAMEPRRA